MGSVAYFLQQGSLLVALSQLSATRYVYTTRLFARMPFPDYTFLLAILQCRSGFAVLVGVGEDAIQCYFREHYHVINLYRFPPSLKRHFFILADCAFYSGYSRSCTLFRLRRSLFLK
jgi:hypothetical protein